MALRDKLIQRTIDQLYRLPDKKLKEASDFVEFLLSRIDDKNLAEGIEKLAKDTKAFRFLEDEEDLYSESDLKERYN